MTDDPVALRSERLFRLFARYLRWRVGRDFHAVRIARDGLPPALPAGRPAIVYSNHPSWWDPALYMLMADMLFRGRPGYGPMDDEAFARYGIFRRLGVFGIDLASTRGARRFLSVARAVLADPDAMIWITAEGTFTDPRIRPVTLRPGLAHLARLRPDAVFVPLALEYGFWEESRPEVFLRYGAPADLAGLRSAAEISARLAAGLEREMDALAAATRARTPSLFAPLVRGHAGAALIYDAWRRIASARRGERFRAAHRNEDLVGP